MAKLTINDPVEQGYYKDFASITKALGVTKQVAYVWRRCFKGTIPERYVEDICKHAAKPLKSSELSIRKVEVCQKGKAFKHPKIADKKLSTYLLTQAGIAR